MVQDPKDIQELSRDLNGLKFRDHLYNLMVNTIPNFALIIFDREMRYQIA